MKSSKRKPVDNRDLWEELLEVSKPHEIRWIKVKGHSGVRENERCDALVREEINTLATKID